MLNEFEIIKNYFDRSAINKTVTVAVGDDAAVFEVPAGNELVTSLDTLNEGVHFFKDSAPFDLGHKALAVSLSDMAAMAAKPISLLLSLSLPKVDKGWLEAFSRGIFTLAQEHQVDLIGGDTCRGSLSISTVLNGIVPKGQAILRHGAQLGDNIYVTGTLGDAALAVTLLKNNITNLDESLLKRLNQPTPRVNTALALRAFLTSAIDISDGLAADLQKLCEASQVGAIIQVDKLPLSAALLRHCQRQQAEKFALCGGDDYELLFTMPANQAQYLVNLNCRVTQIGKITAEKQVRILDKSQKDIQLELPGYDHFAK